MEVALNKFILLPCELIIISLTDKNFLKNKLRNCLFGWIIICDYWWLFICVDDYLLLLIIICNYLLLLMYLVYRGVFLWLLMIIDDYLWLFFIIDDYWWLFAIVLYALMIICDNLLV